MVLFPNSQSPKVDNKLLSTRRFLMLYQYFAQIKDTNISTMSFKQTLTLTLGLVTPTGAITPEEADGAEEALAAKATAVAETIAETVKLLGIDLKDK